jgi:hypothetical protein
LFIYTFYGKIIFMEKPKVTPEIALAAAGLFETPKNDLISTPAYDDAPFPHSYSEYGLTSAAVEALLIADVNPQAIEEHPEVVDEVEEEIREIVANWRDVVLYRINKARILNGYSPEGTFIPN